MDSSATDRINFNTDVLPERDRFPAFCEGMFRHIIGADITRNAAAPFSGALDIRRAGAIKIARISVTPACLMRHANNVGDGNDAIVIQSWKRGSARFTQGENDDHVEAGETLIIDNAKPARLCAESASQFWALTIPRHSIGGFAPGDACRTAGKLTNNSGLRLLFGYLKEIAAEDLTDWRAAQLVGGHLVDLTAFALGAVANGPTREDGVRAARRSAVLREIECRSGDPGLSAAAVAASLGITPRYIHLLLEETGKSFTHHVLDAASGKGD